MTTSKTNLVPYRQAINQLTRDKLAPVYLLYGEEKYLHDDLINRIIDISLDPGTRDFNFDLFYANETSVEKIITVARSYPMMAQFRIVVLKDIHQVKTSEMKYLADYVSRPSQSSCLVLTLPEKRSGKLFNVIFNNSITIDCRKLYDNEVPGWIENYLRSKKLEIERPAIQLLQAQVGNSLFNLVNELEKVQINIYPRAGITLADVQSVTSISKQFNIFELCNAVGEKKFPQAIAILNRLLEQGEAPTGMIIHLMRHLVNLTRIKESIRGGRKTTDDLMKITGLTYYFIHDMMKQANNFTIDELRNSFSYLTEADLHLKTSYQTPGLVMELLLYQLIKGCDSR